MMTTDWGLFHRIDKAIKNAMDDSAAAREVFDMGLEMGRLFGVGEGRMILRSAAELVGGKARVVPEQSATRKIVALLSTVEYLIANFRSPAGGNACAYQTEPRFSTTRLTDQPVRP